ncbi:MAG: DUF489 family protein, partial [Pseudomonadota bacterium]
MTTPPDEQTLEGLDRRSLALAGAVGAARLVRQLADDQTLDSEQQALRDALVAATVVREPERWELIFNDLPAFQRAAHSAAEVLSANESDRRDVLYTVQLVQLAEMLNQQPAVRNRLAELLDALSDDADESLADIYKQSISHLGQRIQVSGSARALQQPAVAAQIRALLLCGVRMGWLWLRLGGKRRQLVFSRGRIVAALREAGTEAEPPRHDPPQDDPP